MQKIIRFQREHCKNCYKCIRHCPVKAIRISDQQAQIIESQCIYCEQCTLVCPQQAKGENNSLSEINEQFRKGKKIIASFHPAYDVMYHGKELLQIVEEMLALGFEEVRFASEATNIIKHEYDRLLKERSEQTESQQLLISGNCPVVIQLIRKHYPELKDCLSPILSLMEVHARMLKSEDENAIVVAISPCISLMSEMDEKENAIDYVITFQELSDWIEQKHYVLQKLVSTYSISTQNINIPDSNSLALAGGLTMQLEEQKKVHFVHAEGLKTCKRILNEIKDGTVFTDDSGLIFLELAVCPNGCLGGPSFAKTKVPLLKTKLMLQETIKNNRKTAATHENAPTISIPSRSYAFDEPGDDSKHIPDYSIRSVLAKMGKTSPREELNCGGCGYGSCRAMAKAVLLGKAELDMCLPYMREREENYSDMIVNAMPGLLITVDYNLRIDYANKAAEALFDPLKQGLLVGEPLSTLMDDYSLVQMISFDKHIVQDQVIFDGNVILDRVLTNDKKTKHILCVMKDITQERKRLDELDHRRANAVALVDKLMADQLKIVHDIAGHLGETAADTKIAIEELKKTIQQEEV